MKMTLKKTTVGRYAWEDKTSFVNAASAVALLEFHGSVDALNAVLEMLDQNRKKAKYDEKTLKANTKAEVVSALKTIQKRFDKLQEELLKII